MKRLFNDGWEFSKQPLFTKIDEMLEKQEVFAPVGLPHDWLIYQANDLYQDSTGWYRRVLDYKKQEDEKVFLYFEGVYMDSRIYVNPMENPAAVFEWKYGYSSFEVDLTPYLHNGKNEIWVSVDHQSPNTRWYSGAGIYRNVWLKTVHEKYIVTDSLYFHAEKADGEIWNMELSAEAVGSDIRLCCMLEDIETGEIQILGDAVPDVSECSVEQIDDLADGENTVLTLNNVGVSSLYRLHAVIRSPKIWDIENPKCYRLKVQLYVQEHLLQEETQTVGFRTTVFDPQQGFFLNGRKVKLNGVCDHHDLGCLGSAFHKQAMRRKLEILKEMGTNALRFSHNMPAPEVMELADEMGLLVVSEAFDMWESPKTTYDYARFFPKWYQKDVASWVRRDRNHPSLILWSIGNEIHDTHAGERGAMWTRRLMEETVKHDPLGNALPTIGSNYMPWENARKCADILKITGYNYGAAYYDAHHEEHPDWIIYGSETGSVVQSRGIYHFPYEKPVLSDVDEQCSALGNSTTSWGAKSAEDCIIAERDHAFSAGQFIWTGFDYIGEPTPYHTRNSYFGQIDTAGFPKDPFYAYQSAWVPAEKKPVLHLFPYWDFNEGQIIDVRAYTNAPKVELFVNGRSQGICEIDHAHGEVLSGNWKVPYEKGEIRAISYDEDGNVLAEDAQHSFGEAAESDLKLSSEMLHADGQELLFVEISMKDAEGYPVENANNRVFVEVTGCGSLVGMDNGDSTDTEEYKTDSRRLFSGKLLTVVKAGCEAGDLTICVSSPNLPAKQVTIPVLEGEVLEGCSPMAYCAVTCTEKVDEEQIEKEAVCRKTVTDEQTEKDAVRRKIAAEEQTEKAAAPGELNVDDFSTGELTAEEKVSLQSCMSADQENDIPVRNIYLTSQGGTNLNPGNQTVVVTAELSPANAADQAVTWCIVDDAGIPSILADLESDGHQVKVTARSDGRFRLRCMSACGTDKVRIISQLEFTVEGLGLANLDPYGFIAGGLYDYSAGTLTNGNEHGVATSRDGESQVGFHRIDFGPYGSDEIILPIFALSGDPYEIKIYEGMPGGEGAELIGDVIYQKPMIWNVYQPETYHLNKRLKGITSICFVVKDKIHLKGFSFVKKNRAFEQLYAGECDQVYGDTYTKDGEWMRGIGNNVTLGYRELDFGETGVTRIRIAGITPLTKNSIILVTEKDGESKRTVLEFQGSEREQCFEMENLTGTTNVEFVFLPGSQFDFHWFRFEK